MKSSLLTAQILIKVFVYGTLKPGESNYQNYCAGRVYSQIDASTKGNLYHLPIGYPAMTTGRNYVQGVLLTFDQPDTLTQLDQLEGYQPGRLNTLNEYCRLIVKIISLWGKPGHIL